MIENHEESMMDCLILMLTPQEDKHGAHAS